MQLYFPSKVVRTFGVTALRGEIVRIGLDWTHTGTVSSSSWVSENRYTTLSGPARASNVASVFVTMTGVGREVVQNTVTLSSGEIVRQQFEIRILQAQESETPNPSCPVLLLPGNDSTGELLTSQPVSWAAAPFALSYNVYLDGELIANTTELEYTFTDLVPVTEYTWTVVPVGDAGELASCGSRTFSTAQLDCPGVTIPTNGSDVGENTSTTIFWPAITNAATYNVYVWENGDPQPGTPTANVGTNTYEVTGLSLGTTYRVLVDAVSAEGYVSPSCGSTTFSTNAADAFIEWQSATFTGDILGASVTLVAVRSGNTTTTASADYAFTAGTAEIGPDFTATPGTVTFAPGDVTQNVVVPLVRDYDAEVLADTPWGYWKFDEASGTTIADASGNGRNLSIASGAFTSYRQPTLNLSTSLAAYRQTVGANLSILRSYNGVAMDGMQAITVCGWVKFDTASPATTRVLFGIGGGGGAGQIAKCVCARNAAGQVSMFWQAHNPSGGSAISVNKTFTTTLPLGEEFWFEAGQDTGNRMAFFSLNGGVREEVPWIAAQDPWQITGRETFICMASSLTTGYRTNGVIGKWSQFEMHLGVTSPGRWPRWNLDAALTFMSTLSNPSVDTQIGAIDETTMTIEAP